MEWVLCVILVFSGHLAATDSRPENVIISRTFDSREECMGKLGQILIDAHTNSSSTVKTYASCTPKVEV